MTWRLLHQTDYPTSILHHNTRTSRYNTCIFPFRSHTRSAHEVRAGDTTSVVNPAVQCRGLFTRSDRPTDWPTYRRPTSLQPSQTPFSSLIVLNNDYVAYEWKSVLWVAFLHLCLHLIFNFVLMAQKQKYYLQCRAYRASEFGRMPQSLFLAECRRQNGAYTALFTKWLETTARVRWWQRRRELFNKRANQTIDDRNKSISSPLAMFVSVRISFK